MSLNYIQSFQVRVRNAGFSWAGLSIYHEMRLRRQKRFIYEHRAQWRIYDVPRNARANFKRIVAFDPFDDESECDWPPLETVSGVDRRVHSEFTLDVSGNVDIKIVVYLERFVYYP